jgi:hypothetical protein
MIRPTVMIVALLALLVVPSLATAAIVPVSPRLALVTTTPAPAFTWRLDAGSAPSSLQVSVNPAVDPATNRLVGASIDQPLAATATGYRLAAAQQLFAGTWHWRVVGATAGIADASPTQPFTIRPVVSRPRLKFSAVGKGTTGVVRVHTNTARFKLGIRIVHGRATCLKRVITRPRTRASLKLWDTYRIYCYPYGGILPGSRVAVAATVSANGLSRTTRTTLIAH